MTRQRTMCKDREQPRKTYLGDGVYVSMDEMGIWLTAENGMEATDEIYLEAEVWESLKRFIGGEE